MADYGPSPAPLNATGFNSNKFSLLGAKTDLVAANLNTAATRYLGPDGAGGMSVSTTATSVPLFSAGGASKLLVLFTGAFGNAVTCTVGIQYYAADGTALVASTVTTAASGSLVSVSAGYPLVATNAATDASLSGIHTYSPIVLPYFRLTLLPSADAGALTGVKLYLYGGI